MKKLALLGGLLLILLGVVTAGAFKSGPDIIRVCPECKAHLTQKTTNSGNTFGARFWTDGKMVAPMLPDRPWLVKCPKCGSLFWIDEAMEFGKRYPRSKEYIIEPLVPSETEFLTVLAEEKLPKLKEIYVRCRAWWAANDSVRMNVDATITFSPKQEKNLQILSDLLDEENADQRIMKAEILRELGKFDECLRLLAQIFDKIWQAKEAGFTKVWHANEAAFIIELVEQKSRIVREIKEK